MESENMTDLYKSIRNQTDVGCTMAQQLFSTQGNSNNLVFSPLSIHVLLSLAAAGAEGPTQDQLLSFLKSGSADHLNSLASHIGSRVFAAADDPACSLSFANGIWADKSLPFKPSFKQVVDTFYKAARNQVDFQNRAEEARIEVNSWVENQTRGLIEDLLPLDSLDQDTMLVFANALYFKGVWEGEFIRSKTEMDDFYTSTSVVKAPFMTNDDNQRIGVFDGFKVLKLLYQGDNNNHGEKMRGFSMCIFLPDKEDGLPGLVERVCSESGFLDMHLPDEVVMTGEFRIPKFKFSSGFEASKVLKDLGLVLPFEGGNLREMVESPPGQGDPLVSSIYHKACIEVNERGTEAAAASVMRMGCTASRRPPVKRIDFVADHPFLFFIREEYTGALVFAGQVLNPLESI